MRVRGGGCGASTAKPRVAELEPEPLPPEIAMDLAAVLARGVQNNLGCAEYGAPDEPKPEEDDAPPPPPPKPQTQAPPGTVAPDDEYTRLVTRAQRATAAGDAETAVELAKQAIKIDSCRPLAHVALGKV